ncbi:hypothetical protein C5167_050438, partial [Papaver somniferum]
MNSIRVTSSLTGKIYSLLHTLKLHELHISFSIQKKKKKKKSVIKSFLLEKIQGTINPTQKLLTK